MRISAIMPRTEIAAIRKTAAVTRSSQADDPDETSDVGTRDAADERPKRRNGQLRATTSASERSSNGVLSALIALQEQR